jgi:hypothetical protein
MKFVVVSHDRYRTTNGGLTVLLTLAKKLYEKGHDSKIYLTTREGYQNNTYFTRYHESDTVDDDTIVIYIDIPVGNILKAKRVVRYITFGSHWYPEYSANEMTYYHAPFCKNNPAKKRLCILYLDPYVKNLGLPRIHNACHVVKKGYRLPEVRNTVYGQNIWTQNHGFCVNHDLSFPEIVGLLNQTKYFFCYDPCSFLIIIALLCGCVVVQHPMNGYSESEWRYTIGIGDIPGIAYGYENIGKAQESIHFAPDACMKLINDTETHIDNFIRDMELPPVYEQCYKFNESKFSLQHIEK